MAIVNAVKEQIRIREIGFGWKDVHTAWSKKWEGFQRRRTKRSFIYIVLYIEGERYIPPETKENFPSRGEQTKLGTRSKDLDVIDNEREATKGDLKITPKDLRETMEMDGQTDRYEKIQPDRPEVNKELIGAQID